MYMYTQEHSCLIKDMRENSTANHICFPDIIRGVIMNKMLKTAVKITNKYKIGKKAIIVAINRFWDLRYEV